MFSTFHAVNRTCLYSIASLRILRSRLLRKGVYMSPTLKRFIKRYLELKKGSNLVSFLLLVILHKIDTFLSVEFMKNNKQKQI